MREILFRGKRKDNGEWIFGSLVHQVDFYGIKVDRYFILEGTHTNDYDIDDPIKVIGETVCQYTGLTDMIGNKIFEGDVVQDMSMYLVHFAYVKDGIETQEQADKYKNYGKIGVVRYNADGDVGSCGCCYTQFVGAGFLTHNVDLTQCIVLGNIHDNPELIDNKTK